MQGVDASQIYTKIKEVLFEFEHMYHAISELWKIVNEAVWGISFFANKWSFFLILTKKVFRKHIWEVCEGTFLAILKPDEIYRMYFSLFCMFTSINQ